MEVFRSVATTHSIRRRRQGSGFCYLAPDGRVIRDNRMRQRLQRLAVPPAYEDVFYATDPDAHIQAIGRDAAGRLQYRYHARWRETCNRFSCLEVLQHERRYFTDRKSTTLL